MPKNPCSALTKAIPQSSEVSRAEHFFSGIEKAVNMTIKEKILKEALNKSRHASCLLIFRHLARKLLEIHQVFLRHFHAILGAASA